MASPEWSELGQPRFYASLIAFFVLHVLVYFLAVRLLPKVFETQTQRAWVMTLFASIITTLSSLPFVIEYAMRSADMSAMTLLDSDLAVSLAAYFISYLWADVAVGVLCYASSFNLVTGWIHHSLYSVLVGFTVVFRVPACFLICGLMELPTVILAVGYLWRNLRSDWGFGTTFFALRIAFHVYFVWTLHTSFPNDLYWVLGVVVYPLHLWWFYSFIMQQIRLYKEKKECATKAGDPESAEGTQPEPQEPAVVELKNDDGWKTTTTTTDA